MLNILHSIDTPGPGGAETVYVDIVTGLDHDRFKSFPVIPEKGWIYEKFRKRHYSHGDKNGVNTFFTIIGNNLVSLSRRGVCNN